MSISILIYTHDEYSFLWKVMFLLCKKYIHNINIHVLYNNNADTNIVNKYIPDDYILHVYDNSLIWTKRILKALEEINDDYILFLHEDWLPIGEVKLSILETMINFMKNINCGFLLSYSHISTTSTQDGIYTGFQDYYYYQEKNHIFQPAIWNKKVFQEFCTTLNKNKNQNEDKECLDFMYYKNCWSVQNKETVTSLRTTNSLMFPHMHAMSEGLWNFKKYPTLKNFLNSYDVDTDSRGIHTWWELDTQ
jgi:hypothetical protein